MRKVYSAPKKSTTIAKKALRLAKQNQRSIEVKELTSSTSSAISNTGTVSSITSIAEGDDFTNRNGRSIKLLSVQIRGAVINQDTTNGDGSFIRMMIVRDNSFGSAAPAVSDVLQSGVSYGLRAQEPEKKAKYTVLWDKLSHVDVNSRNQFTFSGFKKLNTKMIFDGTASTTGNKGGLYLLLVSNRAASGPNVSTQVRVRFADA